MPENQPGDPFYGWPKMPFDVPVGSFTGTTAGNYILTTADGNDNLVVGLKIQSPSGYLDGKMTSIFQSSFTEITDIVAFQPPSSEEQLLKIYFGSSLKDEIFNDMSFIFNLFDSKLCYSKDVTTMPKAMEQGISVGAMVYLKDGYFDATDPETPYSAGDNIPKIWVPGSAKIKTINYGPDGQFQSVEYEDNALVGEYPSYLINDLYPGGVPISGFSARCGNQCGPSGGKEGTPGYYIFVADSAAIENMEQDVQMGGGQIVFKGDCPIEVYGQTLHDQFTSTSHLHTVNLSPDSLNQEKSFEGILEHFYLTPKERNEAAQLNTPQIIRDIIASTKIPGTTILDI